MKLKARTTTRSENTYQFEVIHAIALDLRAYVTIARIKPNNMMKKQVICTVLEVINQKNTFELDQIIVTQVGMYESGCIEPFRTFDCT